jgi:hypothetical protein
LILCALESETMCNSQVTINNNSYRPSEMIDKSEPVEINIHGPTYVQQITILSNQ